VGVQEMRELIIYKSWIENSYFSFFTSNDCNPAEPLPIGINVDIYGQGFGIEFVFLKYSIGFYIGRQHIVGFEDNES
jgi:hypothetical protein